MSNLTYRRCRTCALIFVSTALLIISTPAFTQVDNYPLRPIKIILPVAVGGASDRVLRIIGKSLTDQWGQPFVIEAKPGATGALGAEAVAKSAADGYTALFASTTFIQAPSLLPKVPYNYVTDFTPVSLTTRVTVVFVVSTESPIHSLQDYLSAAAPSKPITYGSVGLGSKSTYLRRDAGSRFKDGDGARPLSGRAGNHYRYHRQPLGFVVSVDHLDDRID